MHDIAFIPQSVTVSTGSTIEWANDDDMAHTVTSGVDRDDGVWTSSPPIAPGGTFTLVLRKPGTYRYFCKPHVYSAAMHATIVVGR